MIFPTRALLAGLALACGWKEAADALTARHKVALKKGETRILAFEADRKR